MPPSVQWLCVDGIGAEGQRVLLGGVAQVVEDAARLHARDACSPDRSRGCRCRYFEKSMTTATLQHCPARLVPPPRDSTGAPWRRQTATVGDDVVDRCAGSRRRSAPGGSSSRRSRRARGCRRRSAPRRRSPHAVRVRARRGRPAAAATEVIEGRMRPSRIRANAVPERRPVRSTVGRCRRVAQALRLLSGRYVASRSRRDHSWHAIGMQWGNGRHEAVRQNRRNRRSQRARADCAEGRYGDTRRPLSAQAGADRRAVERAERPRGRLRALSGQLQPAHHVHAGHPEHRARGAGVAGFFSRRAARTLLPAVSVLTLVDGVVGFCFHVRGIQRKPGGWRLPVVNIVMGPPVFAPLLFGVSGYLGLIASFLRREDARRRRGCCRGRAHPRSIGPSRSSANMSRSTGRKTCAKGASRSTWRSPPRPRRSSAASRRSTRITRTTSATRRSGRRSSSRRC